jgi:hypothetical protein
MDDLFAEEGDEKSEKSGVSERALPAISGGSLKRKAARPKKAIAEAVQAAIHEAMPPAMIRQAIRQAYDLALEHGSPKGIMQVVEFVVSYQLGEPVKRLVTQRSTVEELLSQAAGVDDEQFDSLIDALYDEHSNG